MKTNTNHHERLLSVLIRDEPDVVHKLTGMLRRRGFSMDGISAGKSKEAELLRMTLQVRGDDRCLLQMRQQLYKILETVNVSSIDPCHHVHREMALIKIRHNGDLAKWNRLAELHDARVVESGPQTLIMAITEESNGINAFIDRLERGAVIEIARSGVVAMDGPTTDIDPSNK